jgi:hypothetical protein
LAKLWTRCEESIPCPYYLAPDKTFSYYLLEYVSGGSYQQYPSNSRILNFKIPVKFRHEQRWQYKCETVQYFAERIMECINFPQSDTILIPMPTSKPRNDSEFDSRLDDVVKLVHMKTGQRIGFNLNAIHSSQAFHNSGSSRYVADIGGNINFTPFDQPVPAKVILIDDVVTTGAHFMACRDKSSTGTQAFSFWACFWQKRYGKTACKGVSGSPTDRDT